MPGHSLLDISGDVPSDASNVYLDEEEKPLVGLVGELEVA